MKRFFLKKQIASLLIIAVLCAFSVCNLLANGPALRQELRTIVRDTGLVKTASNAAKGLLGAEASPEWTAQKSADGGGQTEPADDVAPEKNAFQIGSLKAEWGQMDSSLTEAVSRVETAVDENLLGRYAFIESYGAIQRLLGKREENNFEIVRNDEGILFDNTAFTNIMGGERYEVTRQVKRLRDVSEKSGARFLTALVTGKEPEMYAGAAAGYPTDYFHENTEFMREYLEKNDIDYVDLRDPYPTPEGTYYRTDHHWTTQKGFDAFRKMTAYMDEHYGAGLDPDGFLTDPQNYNFIRFPNIYLGSQGRKTGLIYGDGPEDFTLIYPKFITNFKLSIEDYSEGIPLFTQEGRMEDSLIDMGMFMNDWNVYEKDYYGSYMYGVSYPIGHIENRRNPEGPKVLCIRDSYSCVPMTFFASLCSQLDVMYPLKFQGNTRELIEDGDYDYVILMAYPGNYGVGSEGGGFFDFTF